MDFFLFLLVNAALILRPQDLIGSLATVQVYNILIVVNLVVAAPAITNQLAQGIGRSPATVCVIGILAGLVASLVARFDLDGAWFYGVEFLKVVVYFLLMTSVITTESRFSWFLAALVVLTLCLVGLAVADFQGRIDIPVIEHVKEAAYGPDGEPFTFFRMEAHGVFADPNDLAMLVVTSMLIVAGAICYPALGMSRWLLLAPLAFFAYALLLTQSRGGLLALAGGLAIALAAWFGTARSSVLIAGLVPGLLLGVGGRQADIGGAISGGTGGMRTELWYQGLQFIKWKPVFGIGHGQFAEQEAHVAHNSFVQALAEWGLVGGTMFVGLFFLVLYSVWRLRSVRSEIASPMLRSYQPWVMGAVAAYAIAMLSLTRCVVVPTYLIVGLGVAYERLARPDTSLPAIEFTPGLLSRMFLVTLGFIAILYVYVRFIYRMF